MTIDESIAKYKEITNKDAICPAHCNISCDKCVQESEQYKLGFQDGIIAGNNKALNDFVNACKSNSLYKTFGLRQCDIEYIAEQLKVGAGNDKSI